jgi:hypothetical protein
MAKFALIGKPCPFEPLAYLCRFLRPDSDIEILGCPLGHVEAGRCRPYDCPLDWLKDGRKIWKLYHGRPHGQKDGSTPQAGSLPTPCHLDEDSSR